MLLKSLFRVNNRSIFTRLVCHILYTEFSKQGGDKRPSISLHNGNSPILLNGAIVMKNQNPTNLEVPSMTHFFQIEVALS